MSFCIKSCSLEVPIGSVDTLPFQFAPLLFPFLSTISRNSISRCVDSSHLGAEFSLEDASGYYSQGIVGATRKEADRRTVWSVGASNSGSSGSGLPIPLSVPRPKGEDDQR